MNLDYDHSIPPGSGDVPGEAGEIHLRLEAYHSETGDTTTLAEADQFNIFLWQDMSAVEGDHDLQNEKLAEFYNLDDATKWIMAKAQTLGLKWYYWTF